MKYFIIITLAAAASAARLEKVYLPPNAGVSSGANAGLQTPFTAPGSSQQYQQAPTGPAQDYQGQNYQSQNYQGQNYQSQNLQAQNQNQAEILRYENEINEDGFHYAYETSDGTKAEQEGRVIPGAKPEEGSLQVSGSYSYIGDDGQTYSVTYTADENGFRPEGGHLPTPPPIPEAILKSLQLTAGAGGNDDQAQYNSGKSSYDADSNGY